jgi:hypothetical protein
MYCIWCGAAAAGDVVIRCGSCERTHFLNSKISASALVVADGHHLTIQRAAPPEDLAFPAQQLPAIEAYLNQAVPI